MNAREQFFYETLMRERLTFNQLDALRILMKSRLRIKQLKVIVRHELTPQQMLSLGKEFLQGASIEEVQEKVNEIIQNNKNRPFLRIES